MSGIYFHCLSEQVRIRGAERAYASVIVNMIGKGALEHAVTFGEERKAFEHHLRGPDTTEDALRFFTVTPAVLELPDMTVDLYDVALNTALVLGCDSVRLLARLHAQCEVHLWVDEPNLPWLREIIVEGLQIGVLREDMGWDELVGMLGRVRGPVVTSYSVTEQFPNPTVCGWEGEDDEWYERDHEEHWADGVRMLRENRSPGRQLTPQNIGAPLFGCGLTWQTLGRRLYQLGKEL